MTESGDARLLGPNKEMTNQIIKLNTTVDSIGPDRKKWGARLENLQYYGQALRNEIVHCNTSMDRHGLVWKNIYTRSQQPDTSGADRNELA